MSVLLFLPAFSVAQNVTIADKDFYLDRKPWLPKGTNAEGFIRPAFIPAAPKWMNDPVNQKGRAWWSDQELQAVETVCGANIIRFNISQAALDFHSSIL
jgi:endoglucanase